MPGRARGKPKGATKGGRFGSKPSNNSKKKAKGKNASIKKSKEYPELMDLEQATFVPEIGAPKSMKAASRKPGRRLLDEAKYTDSHTYSTLKRELRHMPIIFVKAAETYDPSKDIIKKKSNDKHHMNVENEVETTISVLVRESELDELDEGGESEASFENIDAKTDIIGTFLTGAPKSKTEIIETLTSNGIVREDGTGEAGFESQNDFDSEKQSKSSKPRAVPDFQHYNSSESDGGTEGLEFFKDDTGDSEINSKKYTKPSTSSLVETSRRYTNNQSIKNADNGQSGNHIEHDSVLTIGKVSLQTKIIDDSVEAFTMSVPSFPRKAFLDENTHNLHKLTIRDDDDEIDDSRSEDSDSELAYRDYVQQLLGDNLGHEDTDSENENAKDDSEVDYKSDECEIEEFSDLSESDEESSNSGFSASESENDSKKESDTIKSIGPEYGFLPEDFDFDTSTVTVSQIRQGISNQYFVKSFQLTGLQDEYIWVDEEDLIDFVLDNGVKSHRVPSYIRYISQGLLEETDPIEDETLDISDMISDSDEEEESIEDLLEKIDDDNMASLISFAKSQQNFFANLDIPSTKSLRTKGKGKGKKLDLGHVDDNDLREALQDQYLIHKKSRKQKRKERQLMDLQNRVQSNDLLVKYPTVIHIREARNEIEAFLHSDKESLAFPPMKPFGVKTICKMAYHYNMKPRRLGKGTNSHAVVIKTKRTFNNYPDYDSLNRMVKKGIILERIDVNRTSSDVSTFDSKKKVKGPSSKAHVKEGEIVGLNAPEIGQDNIGRILLEKLGWTQGQGLGSEGNEGINAPVVAKIKHSKEGLK